MKLPFPADPRRKFTLKDIEAWTELHNPEKIEMDDAQYSWFANLNGMNLKTVKGIPIVFDNAATRLNDQLGHL